MTCTAGQVKIAGVITIEDMLHRRNDLSTFLVHFTRPPDGMTSGLDALKSIVSQNMLEARTAYGAATHLPWAVDSQKVVCFTETPLEHSWTMTLQLAERRTSNFAPYGLAFTRRLMLAEKHANQFGTSTRRADSPGRPKL